MHSDIYTGRLLTVQVAGCTPRGVAHHPPGNQSAPGGVARVFTGLPPECLPRKRQGQRSILADGLRWCCGYHCCGGWEGAGCTPRGAAHHSPGTGRVQGCSQGLHKLVFIALIILQIAHCGALKGFKSTDICPTSIIFVRRAFKVAPLHF
jgi:hypothetical protein